MHQYLVGNLAEWGLFAAFGVVTLAVVYLLLFGLGRRKRDRLEQAENEKDMRRLDERLQQDKESRGLGRTIPSR